MNLSRELSEKNININVSGGEISQKLLLFE